MRYEDVVKCEGCFSASELHVSAKEAAPHDRAPMREGGLQRLPPGQAWALALSRDVGRSVDGFV